MSAHDNAVPDEVRKEAEEFNDTTESPDQEKNQLYQQANAMANPDMVWSLVHKTPLRPEDKASLARMEKEDVDILHQKVKEIRKIEGLKY